MKNQYIRRLPEKGRRGLGKFVDLRGGLIRKRGGLKGGGAVDTPITTMIILFHLELSRIGLPKLNSGILMKIVTIPVGQVDEFYFYMYYPIKVSLFQKIIFELIYLFHIVYKNHLHPIKAGNIS